jgi:hypothetical protein
MFLSSLPEERTVVTEDLEHGVGALAQDGEVGEVATLRQDGQALPLELLVLGPSKAYMECFPPKILFPLPKVIPPPPVPEM